MLRRGHAGRRRRRIQMLRTPVPLRCVPLHRCWRWASSMGSRRCAGAASTWRTSTTRRRRRAIRPAPSCRSTAPALRCCRCGTGPTGCARDAMARRSAVDAGQVLWCADTRRACSSLAAWPQGWQPASRPRRCSWPSGVRGPTAASRRVSGQAGASSAPAGGRASKARCGWHLRRAADAGAVSEAVEEHMNDSLREVLQAAAAGELAPEQVMQANSV